MGVVLEAYLELWPVCSHHVSPGTRRDLRRTSVPKGPHRRPRSGSQRDFNPFQKSVSRNTNPKERPEDSVVLASSPRASEGSHLDP